MDAGLVIIEGGVFDITARLREIDSGYFAAYNQRLRRFEVHNRRQRDTLALVVPFDRLDSRTVSLCLKTRRENIDRLIKEMDDANAAAERNSDQLMLNRARGRIEEAIGL